MTELGAFLSEQYAFERLGIAKHMIKTEKEMIEECDGKVPEGIFWDPVKKKIISVEVKRIVGNRLPKEGGGRKILRRRKHIIWPWQTTIMNAMNKISEQIVHNYKVQEHHIVIIIPNDLGSRAYNRICNHSYEIFYNHAATIGMKINHMHMHFLSGPLYLFDRF